MTFTSRTPGREIPGLPGARLPVTKQLMALDALSQLNQYIAEHPDFYSLLNLLLLTICGQCSVANAFAAIRNPRSRAESPVLFATGRYEQDPRLASPAIFDFFRAYFRRTAAPAQFIDAGRPDAPAEVAETLKTLQVKLIMPLGRDGEFIGILGIGARPHRPEFTDAEVDLLSLLVHAVSPFMATLSREYFDLFNSVKQSVFIFDCDERLVRLNAGALRILEAARRKSLDARLDYGAPLDDVFCEPVFGGWVSEIRRSRTVPRGRVVRGLIAKQPDADRFFTARVSNINRREDGRCDLLIVLEDVTEQTQNEQRLYELQKFAEQGVMTSAIAHELGNHVALVIGGLELAQRHLSDDNPGRAQAAIERLMKGLEQLRRYTAGLTDRGQMLSRKTTTGLNTLILNLLPFVKVQRKFKRISLDVRLDAELPDLEIDCDQISQLLLNLLYNAADAIEDTAREDAWIRITTERRASRPCLTVADNGIGMPEAVRAKLFQERITTKEGGHGFGLVMCAKIIKDHAADVEVVSEIGKGTTFTIRFAPLSAAEDPTSDHRKHPKEQDA
jgi:signal transduction histidine kinase